MRTIINHILATIDRTCHLLLAYTVYLHCASTKDYQTKPKLFAVHYMRQAKLLHYIFTLETIYISFSVQDSTVCLDNAVTA